MSQINQDFAERMVSTADAGKFSSLTQWEQKQLALAWLALHGHLTWPGMPSVRALLKEARSYVASYAQAPGCATAANDMLLDIDNALNAAPQVGAVSTADPATNYGEPAVAAPSSTEERLTEGTLIVAQGHARVVIRDAEKLPNAEYPLIVLYPPSPQKTWTDPQFKDWK